MRKRSTWSLRCGCLVHADQRGCASLSREYKHVSLSDRVEIEKLLDAGHSQAEIARRLGRHRSTISREISRRSWRPSNTSAAYTPYRPTALRTSEVTARQYRAVIAQRHADQATRRSHQAVRMRHDRLVGYVRERLRRGWTPEEIAGRLPLEFGEDPVMQVSHETLYAWIYAPAQRKLKLWQYLPRGQRKRRRRGPARKVRRAPQIRYRLGIETRPAVVEDRAEFGHWEADSVLGVRGTGALHTEVERTSRFVVAAKIDAPAAGHTLRVQQAMIAALPAHAVKSITADWGSPRSRGRVGVRLAPQTRRRHGRADLFRRPVLVLATRHQRTLQRPHPQVPAQTHPIRHPHPRRVG